MYITSSLLQIPLTTESISKPTMKHNLGHLQNKHEDIVPLDVFIEGLV